MELRKATELMDEVKSCQRSHTMKNTHTIRECIKSEYQGIFLLSFKLLASNWEFTGIKL